MDPGEEDETKTRSLSTHPVTNGANMIQEGGGDELQPLGESEIGENTNEVQTICGAHDAL